MLFFNIILYSNTLTLELIEISATHLVWHPHLYLPPLPLSLCLKARRVKLMKAIIMIIEIIIVMVIGMRMGIEMI